MKYKVIILIEASRDFKESKEWYKKVNVKGLPDRFKNSIKTTIANLQSSPKAYAVRYKNIRIAHTDKFPFAIHFFIDNKLVVITAIIYSGRDPKITYFRV